MRLDGWTIGSISAIAAAATAALFVLHLLKPRPSRLRVVTTLFWKQVQAAPQPSNLLQRFAHRRTFVLLLAILLLLTGALGKPFWSGKNNRKTIIVVDASAAVARRWPAVASQAAGVLQAARRQGAAGLIVANPLPQVLLALDEPAAHLEADLKALHPAGPDASSEAIKLARSMLGRDQSDRVLWMTDRSSLPAELEAEEGATIQRIELPSPGPNAGLLWAGATAKEVGWAIEIRVALSGRPDNHAAEEKITLNLTGDGKLLASDIFALQPGQILSRRVDIPAVAEQAIQIDLVEEDEISADNHLRLILPRRPTFTFKINGDIPRPLRDALAALSPADAGQSLPAKVIQVGSSATEGQPNIVLIQDSSRLISAGVPISLAHTNLFARPLELENAVTGAGSAIDIKLLNAEPLLQAGDGVLAAMSTSGPPRLYLSDALIAPDATLWKRAAFPLLIEQACLKLIGQKGDGLLLPEKRLLIDPLFANQQPGQLTGLSGVSSDVPAGTALLPPAEAFPLRNRLNIEPYQILLLLAGALLLVEAWLHGRGRIF